MIVEVGPERRSDVIEFVVVHRTLRREFGLLPLLVRSVPPFDAVRARQVCQHATELVAVLRCHQQIEDDLLAPMLVEPAASAELAQLVERAGLAERIEYQHARVLLVLDRVDRLLPGWGRAADLQSRTVLAGLFAELAWCVRAHLDDSDRNLLPMVAEHLSPRECTVLGRRGLRSVPRHRVPVLLAQLCEEADEAERARILAGVRPVRRWAYRMFGARRYQREVQLLRGPLALSA